MRIISAICFGFGVRYVEGVTVFYSLTKFREELLRNLVDIFPEISLSTFREPAGSNRDYQNIKLIVFNDETQTPDDWPTGINGRQFLSQKYFSHCLNMHINLRGIIYVLTISGGVGGRSGDGLINQNDLFIDLEDDI